MLELAVPPLSCNLPGNNCSLALLQGSSDIHQCSTSLHDGQDAGQGLRCKHWHSINANRSFGHCRKFSGKLTWIPQASHVIPLSEQVSTWYEKCLVPIKLARC